MDKKIEKWESPNCPSGQLEQCFKLAEKFRASEHAPSVRLDHFLLAVILILYAPTAEDVLKVFERVKKEWHSANISHVPPRAIDFVD